MIRVGCQTYTWEMLEEKFLGSIDTILDLVSEAGYEGIEISNTMIDYYYDDPDKLKDALHTKNLVLAAFAYASPHGFSNPSHRQEEMDGALKAISFVRKFPRALLALGGGASSDRTNYDEKITNVIGFYREIASICSNEGVRVTFHPHSHSGSLIDSEEEYDHVLQSTEGTLLGFNPDTGHITRSGNDVMKLINKYIHRVIHVHMKDVDIKKRWQPMGKGTIGFRSLIHLLEHSGYDGWIICEEESKGAYEDQFNAIKTNRDYLKSLGY
ncbi:MAG: sugar phosphate isomerase/epimerase [Spirochaetota bacterium]|nr:MAG: sugar phosphate isomerase/epimerase [Spirochaetota bacterium]